MFMLICFGIIKAVRYFVTVNRVRHYTILVTMFHLYDLLLSQYLCHYSLESNEHLYEFIAFFAYTVNKTAK